MKKTIASILIIITILFTAFPRSIHAQQMAASTTIQSMATITSTLEALLGKLVTSIKDVTGDILKKALTAAEQSFSDFKSSAWYAGTMAKLVSIGVLNGDGNGKIHPNGEVQVDQFIKMVVTALGHTDIQNGDVYWADPFIHQAKQMGLIQEGEFYSYKQPITRGEIARLLVRALEYQGERDYPTNIQEYATNINDYYSMPNLIKEFALKAYVKGIMGGYPDGTFKVENKATRAEASAMIARLLDKNERNIPKLGEDKYLSRTVRDMTEFPAVPVTEYCDWDQVPGKGSRFGYWIDKLRFVEMGDLPIEIADSVIYELRIETMQPENIPVLSVVHRTGNRVFEIPLIYATRQTGLTLRRDARIKEATVVLKQLGPTDFIIKSSYHLPETLVYEGQDLSEIEYFVFYEAFNKDSIAIKNPYFKE